MYLKERGPDLQYQIARYYLLIRIRFRFGTEANCWRRSWRPSSCCAVVALLPTGRRHVSAWYVSFGTGLFNVLVDWHGAAALTADLRGACDEGSAWVLNSLLRHGPSTAMRILHGRGCCHACVLQHRHHQHVYDSFDRACGLRLLEQLLLPEDTLR